MQKVKRMWCGSIIGLLILTDSTSNYARAQASNLPVDTSLCEIFKNEKAFSGKLLHLKAQYSPWWEGSVLEDKACDRGLYDFDMPADGIADATTRKFAKAIEVNLAHWQPVEYEVDFEARLDPANFVGGHGFTHDGILKVTRIRSYRLIKDAAPLLRPADK